MTGQQYLMQAFRMKKKIESMQEDIIRLEAAATDCSPNLTGMPHNPSPSHSRMADIVCKLIDRKAELEKKVAELTALIAEMKYKLSLMENEDYKELLYKRYLEGKTWQDVADEMHFSERWVYKHHILALKEFEINL